MNECETLRQLLQYLSSTSLHPQLISLFVPMTCKEVIDIMADVTLSSNKGSLRAKLRKIIFLARSHSIKQTHSTQKIIVTHSVLVKKRKRATDEITQ